ncbi:hypothetical protein [Clostridium gasigenes]|uniref:hypothetical protein n=1 Tax=Clostridium gasigenes TaxID=94869 RepID=UPI001C0C20DB|nr:hypothetical protein [Clostridium gasigenes]MBU3107729.1 hypothetical protein [Clostridium gasigenes]
MSKIIIYRTSQYTNNMRNYEIYVDGQKINTISDSEKKTIEVSKGNHEIYMKIDWCKSKKLNINFTEEQEVKLKCGSKIEGRRRFLALLYIFVPNKCVYLDYLSEGEVVSNNRNFKTFNEIKSLGRKNYILKYGIVGWGIPTTIIVSILKLLFNSETQALRSFIINLLIFPLVGGTLFGLIMWEFVRKKKC